ncbi:HlyD family efflux transporter periplasmic adaptor subunit [Amycolatopsis sp. SID8362]|uniref:efflux RND transporter periplasmic adaptor subunit n=1 Tax=Amycolatopsis sp. SID8362 TaxID=2690346 RepID=UPI0013684546|nr:HlyD family efflux transporter periplasmic adaptor subunit [Amycolatopsis sp. SID8362]NBH04343.1 HlyD family efflux transporter periplasmic adaptor subunit [Amycolatopsis sp. SID8362]NED41042.1 HlyD family efflux transporter periplasmic adaptor subunit [Amycolatopsis sp. SID8362]
MTRVRASKAWVINGALVVLLAGAGFGIYQAFSPEPNTAQAQTRSTQVRRATVTETISAAGTLASSYTGAANFATAGKVTSIDVKVGDVVSAGQKLATVDSTQAAKQLQVAKANLAVAQDNLDTAEDAEATPATGQNGQNSTQSAANSVTSAQAKLDQAQLDVQTAQEALDNTTLYAPGAGTVTAVNGTVGQQSSSGSASSSQSSSSSSGSGQGGQGSSNSAASSSSSSSSSGFITITNMTGLVVNTSVAEIDVSKVKTGQKATVTLNALPDKPIQATVSSINLTPTTSGSVVSYGAQLALTAPPDGLRPGQSASVVITVASADNALSVPAAAVTTAGNTNVVTVQENGQNVTRQVQIGIRGESTVQITSGLTEGESVVLTGASATTGTGRTGTGTGGTGGFPGGGTGGFPGGQRGTGTGAGGGFGGRG